MSRVFFVVFLVMLSLRPALSTAGELGNVFGSPEIEELSRQASAEALAGLRDLMEAARLRELGEGTGQLELSAAAASLGAAANGFAQLSDLLAIDLTEGEADYARGRLRGTSLENSERLIETITISELLTELGFVTGLLSTALAQQAESPSPVVLPTVSEITESVLILGEVISTISEGRLE